MILSPQQIILTLAGQLAERTIERDNAQRELAKVRAEVDSLGVRLAELVASIEDPADEGASP